MSTQDFSKAEALLQQDPERFQELRNSLRKEWSLEDLEALLSLFRSKGYRLLQRYLGKVEAMHLRRMTEAKSWDEHNRAAGALAVLKLIAAAESETEYNREVMLYEPGDPKK